VLGRLDKCGPRYWNSGLSVTSLIGLTRLLTVNDLATALSMVGVWGLATAHPRLPARGRPPSSWCSTLSLRPLQRWFSGPLSTVIMAADRASNSLSRPLATLVSLLVLGPWDPGEKVDTVTGGVALGATWLCGWLGLVAGFDVAGAEFRDLACSLPPSS